MAAVRRARSRWRNPTVWPRCLGPSPVSGNSSLLSFLPKHICASIVERQNLSVRMGTRRFTWLTNAFSKKWENHWAGVARWFAFYKFCHVHKTLRTTPAIAARISNHVWSVRNFWRRHETEGCFPLNGRDRHTETATTMEPSGSWCIVAGD